MQNQFGVLVHELSTSINQTPWEGQRKSYGINQIVAQNADFQLDNANNFACYAACKSPATAEARLQYYS